MNNLLNRLSTRVVRTANVNPQSGRVVTPMPALKDGFLTEILDAMDGEAQVSRLGTGDGAYGHYSHVSSLIGACVRMHALAALDDRVIRETVTGGHRVMWAIGRYVEQHIRNQYLRATNRRMAFGRWKCACGFSEHAGHHPATQCERCGQGLNDYNEYTLYDHDNWIKGNPDLLVVLPGDWMVPVEIKSMTPKQFNELKAPKGDHVFQLAHYHRMAGLAGFKVHTHGIVIYCTKEFKYGSPYKEFPVDMSTPLVQNLMADSISIARELRQTREHGTLPPRTLCDGHGSTRAKNCPFVVGCFNRS